MASSKEMQYASRPIAHQRPSLSTPSNSLPNRSSHARNNSHSLLSGSLNPNHRVTRRKSVTNNAPNVAALTAVIADSERSAAIPISNGARRNTMSKSAAMRASIAASLPSPPASLPIQRANIDSAIDDDSNGPSDEEGTDFKSLSARRASDGQPLSKEGKKNRVEVKCDQCGKSYKHSSCLTKHLWEHTPEWSLTSKLLISKHQQVQLLEAASVLVAMNGPVKEADAATPPESTKDSASEPDSASPAASGFSEHGDRQSSVETTPPPSHDGNLFNGLSYREKPQEQITFSRSYHPTTTNNSSLLSGGMPWTGDRRPSSGQNLTGKDDRDLAAAVELLSCSFNSNNGSQGTVIMHKDAPPVPAVPAQFLDQATSLSKSFINSFPSRQPESFTRGELRRGSEDVKMEETNESMTDDDDVEARSRTARSDEDDDGVFGRMEE
ncbi:Putative Expressed protein [[Torrubiella] hemipterigena]|uniref:Putative Expressed protein n=1 Tax=[Torrubiella] hemipterigena TaxID=1531966 RepID=A0A0A1TL64_9HYPO|nr:Putative Expressed protein [[Torrubiella] hemipterigena]